MEIRRLVVLLLTVALFIGGCILEEKQFSGSDSSAPITDNNYDDLADILMETGNLSWSELKIELKSDDTDSNTCYSTSHESSSDCTYDEDDDPYWTEGETVTIRENGKGLCNAGDNGGCKMTFLIKTISSNGEEKLLQEIDVTVE